KKARLGLQFARQTRKVEAGEDIDLNVGSIFFVARTSPKTHLFARVDRLFDPNPKGEAISYIPFAATAKSTFVVAGVDVSPIPNVHLMPNIEAIFYDGAAGSSNPDSDVIPRLTFFYKF
ncbi:MAG: hypothetical protein D6814_01065, partial [Calditrichaeota bacterium]